VKVLIGLRRDALASYPGRASGSVRRAKRKLQRIAAQNALAREFSSSLRAAAMSFSILAGGPIGRPFSLQARGRRVDHDQ
jgi:hypothetical protein